MRLWKVRVNCYHIVSTKSQGEMPSNYPRLFYVEASDSQDAARKAEAYADQTADGSREWVKFEFHQAARIELPMEILP